EAAMSHPPDLTPITFGLPAAPQPPAPSFTTLWGSDLAGSAPPRSWLWHGYLAPGNVTLLTSQWKSGKTTLVAVLLARMKTGGRFADRPLAAGKAVVISEESPVLWHHRAQRLHFGDNVGWFCRPFKGKPTPEEWLALLDYI